MPTYSGITSDPDGRRQRHEAENKNVRNWRLANGGRPFSSREAAQAWEDRQPGEHHGGGASASGPWFGYSFEYDY